ncbi:MAG: acyl-ACP--UDP-N-acetylglucosamine O-acyltransferase [Planctomycetota bacterium]
MDIIPITNPQPDKVPQPPQISKLASVHPDAQIADDVVIGPFCVVDAQVKIGRGTLLKNNVSLLGNVSLGEYNRICPGAVIGGEPQDISYTGSETKVAVGDRNIIRENVTIHRASEKEDGVTSLGSDCYLMACSHIAHDCVIGDKVVLGQGSMLGGHVHVHHHASISGCVAVVHFVTIGSYIFLGGSSRAMMDLPPFMLSDGNPARPRCINIVGLKRNNFKKEVINAINEAFRLLYRSRVGLDNAIEILANKNMMYPELEYCFDFVRTSQSGRHGRGREIRKAAA